MITSDNGWLKEMYLFCQLLTKRNTTYSGGVSFWSTFDLRCKSPACGDFYRKAEGNPQRFPPQTPPFLAKNEGFCIRQTKRTCCRHPCAKRISIRGEAGFLRRAHKLHTPCMDLNVPTRMDGAFCFDCKRRKHTQTGGTERFSMEFAAAPPCL